MKEVQTIANDVITEINRARKMWGTSFDEKNTLNDWIVYVNVYLAQASKMNASKEEIVTNLRKAAGLVLNALLYAENDSLAPRHYDGQERPTSLPEIDSDKGIG